VIGATEHVPMMTLPVAHFERTQPPTGDSQHLLHCAHVVIKEGGGLDSSGLEIHGPLMRMEHGLLAHFQQQNPEALFDARTDHGATTSEPR